MTIELYSLKKDGVSVRHMQEASTSPDRIGLKNTHGLIGTDEWWEKVGTHALPLQSLSGRVSAFWPGQHGDYAEFELREDSGACSVWPCNQPALIARTMFAIGVKIELDYVVQEYKVPFGKHSLRKVVTSIREA